MKIWVVISGVASTLFVASILTFGLSTEIASAHGSHPHNDPCTGPHKKDSGCDGGGDSSEGGKAFLFEIAAADVSKCDATPVSVDTSFGHVSWAGNVLWDSNNIHVHFKLQLKDVDLGTYPIFGNNDGDDLGRACSTGTPDFPLCADDNCTASSITVKQNLQGRTSGVLQLPGHDPGETTTVWATVTVSVNGDTKILRSTPVTVVLPPNEVGTGTSCLPE